MVDLNRTKSGSHFTGKILQLELFFPLTTGGHRASTSKAVLRSAELPTPVNHGSVNGRRCALALPAIYS